MYINCHSYNSLRYGTLTVERLSELAAAAGVERLVLTDINNTTGVPDFVRECRNRNITPAAGIEVFFFFFFCVPYRHNISGDPLPPCPPSFPNAYVIYPAGGIDAPSALPATYCATTSTSAYDPPPPAASYQ